MNDNRYIYREPSCDHVYDIKSIKYRPTDNGNNMQKTTDYKCKNCGVESVKISMIYHTLKESPLEDEVKETKKKEYEKENEFDRLKTYIRKEIANGDRFYVYKCFLCGKWKIEDKIDLFIIDEKDYYVCDHCMQGFVDEYGDYTEEYLEGDYDDI